MKCWAVRKIFNVKVNYMKGGGFFMNINGDSLKL